MTFQREARKVLSSATPMGLRVLALCHCVEKYSPIGFQATLDYLEATAGPFRADENSLVSAVTMLQQAHSLWIDELRHYAAQRRAAKRAGQRAPRPTDRNPNVLRTWHGREKEAALFAVRRWHDLTGGRRTGDARERTVAELAVRALESVFSADDRATLEGLLRELNVSASASWKAYQADSNQYFRDRSLGSIAHHLQVATGAGD